MKYIVKNILEAMKEGMFDAILHQTNCYHRWNSGLAPQIKEAYPQAYRADLTTKFADPKKLGTCTISTLLTEKDTHCLIVNCYGQYRNCSAGGTTDYDALRSALIAASQLLPAGSKLGFPKIGCGAAKGDWNVVSAMIKDIFQNFDVTICVLNETEIPHDAN